MIPRIDYPITEFRGVYRFLSNFYPSVITHDGITYETVEHAYQAAKTDDPNWKESIAYAEKASWAKRLGRQCPIRKTWESEKVSVMKSLLLLKFKDTTLKKELLDTGCAELVEGNCWGDTFWGVCNGHGENHLGKLLMEVREEIRRSDAESYAESR